MLPPLRDHFADENVNSLNRVSSNPKTDLMSSNAPPFFSSKLTKDPSAVHHQLHDPLGNLKRTRSWQSLEKAPQPKVATAATAEREFSSRSSTSIEEEGGIRGRSCRTTTHSTRQSLPQFWRPFLQTRKVMLTAPIQAAKAQVCARGRWGRG
ncbi:unnamed protein product [Musa acuminata var. zebrina]